MVHKTQGRLGKRRKLRIVAIRAFFWGTGPNNQSNQSEYGRSSLNPNQMFIGGCAYHIWYNRNEDQEEMEIDALVVDGETASQDVSSNDDSWIQYVNTIPFLKVRRERHDKPITVSTCVIPAHAVYGNA